jgi:hypothetical protein
MQQIKAEIREETGNFGDFYTPDLIIYGRIIKKISRI